MLNLKKKQNTNIVLKQSIAFWSPFSHGSTTCAIAYAKALKELYNASVAIVELDMLHPSFDKYFPDNSGGFKEILRSDRIDRITFEMIRNAAIHDDFDVYKNYFSYIDLNNINIDIMHQILYKITSMYDFVIFDTNRNFDNKLTDLALNLADRVIIPIKPNPLELNLLNRYLELFEDHQDWSVLKCAALVNQYSGDDPIFVDIEKTLKTSVLGYVKSEKPHLLNKTLSKVFLKVAESEVRK